VFCLMALTGAAFWQLADFTNIGLKSAYREGWGYVREFGGAYSTNEIGATVRVRKKEVLAQKAKSGNHQNNRFVTIATDAQL